MAKKKKTIRSIPQQRTPVREQDPQARVKNFEEVNCGYSLEQALNESERCLLCPDPACVAGCPVNINIPKFIEAISAKNFRGAYDAIAASNLLAAVCGRVCPQETQCEGVCVVGDSLEPVAIGRLERWVGDYAIKEKWTNVPYAEPSGFKIGIVGSGPAGMACAADMANAGCDVTVYEAFHEPGGVLKYGIPDFRLPNTVVNAEIENMRKLGVKFECNTLVGRLFTIEQMRDELGFDAVFVGTGAGYPSMLGIPGDTLNGVLSANELLTRCNLMRAKEFPNFDKPIPLGKHVAVINDGKGNVRAMRCIKMQLGEPDDSGRRRPIPVAGSEFEFETDQVVFAIGTNANPIIGQTCKLRLNKRGYIATDETLATSMAGVFAGGDIVTGAATVIEAMGAGRKAARSIKNYLRLRDSGDDKVSEAGVGTFFGIDLRERNFARIRAA